jgi:siroheme synthase
LAGQGRLACVGVGMLLGGHVSPRAQAEITAADVVFAVVSDPLVELWLREMHPDVRSLQSLYAEGKSRHRTYDEMIERVMGEVRAGRRVCAVFYGHPGVFARMPHRAIALARAEGFAALMEPGISAEDCLYADLGIDPGEYGCQHYEASQFLLYRRHIDPSAYLILWQVSLAGDHSHRRYATGPAHRALLVERLLETYRDDHPVTVYEAATLAIQSPRMDALRLDALADADLRLQSTLVVPPAQPMRHDEAMRARMAALDEAYPVPESI